MEEACEYGLTRGTCFFARRLELVVVAGRLWISWCVLGWADFYRFFFSFLMRPFFAFRAKKPLHTGVRTGCHYLISLSVCLSVCV